MFNKFKKVLETLKTIETEPSETVLSDLPPIPVEPEPAEVKFIEPEPVIPEPAKPTLMTVESLGYGAGIVTQLLIEDDSIFYPVQRVKRSAFDAMRYFDAYREDDREPQEGWISDRFSTSYYPAEIEVTEETIRVFSNGIYIGEVRPERYRRIMRFLRSSLLTREFHLMVKEGPQWVYHPDPAPHVTLNDFPFGVYLHVDLVDRATDEQKAEFEKLQTIPEDEEDWARLDQKYDSCLLKPMGVGKNNPKALRDLIYSTNYVKLKQSELFKDQWMDKLLKDAKPRKWTYAYSGNRPDTVYQPVWTDQIQIEEQDGKLAVKSGHLTFGYLPPTSIVTKNYPKADYIWLEVRGGPVYILGESNEFSVQDKPFRVNLHIAKTQ